MSNVKTGDLARVVAPGTLNNGAIVRVGDANAIASLVLGDLAWSVEGVNLALFALGELIPREVADGGTCLDRCLRRIDPDELPLDLRALVDDEAPAPTQPVEVVS